MGLQINLRHASWLAYVLQPSGKIPPFWDGENSPQSQRSLLERFVRDASDRFFSAHGDEHRWNELLSNLAESVSYDATESPQLLHAIEGIREFLGNRPWTALIVPSGRDRKVDGELSSREFLRELIRQSPDSQGLVLQVEDLPSNPIELTDLFPAFETALAFGNHWPGILFWDRHGDAGFFPLGESGDYFRRAKGILTLLATFGTQSPKWIMHEFENDVRFRETQAEELTIIHLSDVHIGSGEAAKRLQRIPKYVNMLKRRFGASNKFLLAISGDIIETPSEENAGIAAYFLDSMKKMAGCPLVTCWGNHDIRRKGFADRNFGPVMGLVSPGPEIVSLCEGRLGFVVFNSVMGEASLAHGKIGSAQMVKVGNMIEESELVDGASLIGMLHHHPMSVTVPDWHQSKFYEFIMNGVFWQTDSLMDATEFLEFAKERRFGCLIHGHKHIPHISRSANGIPVIGCGSSVGKVGTIDGSPYISVNTHTFDPYSRRLTSQLFAERVDGGGLRSQRRAQIVRLGSLRR
jgi:hypothetical protein